MKVLVGEMAWAVGIDGGDGLGVGRKFGGRDSERGAGSLESNWSHVNAGQWRRVGLTLRMAMASTELFPDTSFRR